MRRLITWQILSKRQLISRIKDEWMIQNNKKIGCASIAVVFSAIMIAIMHLTGIKTYILQKVGNVNIPMYVLMVCFFIIGYYIAWKIPLRWDSGFAKYYLGTVSIASVVFSIVSFNFEPLQMDAGARLGFLFNMDVKQRMHIVIVFLIVVFVLIIKFKLICDNLKWEKYLFFSMIVVLVITCATYYMPNLSEGYILYHFHAYSNSIYNVLNGVPFEEGVYSIYGHYAFFYAPIIKIFMLLGVTNEVKIITFLAICLILLSIVMYAYVLQAFIHNYFLKTIALVLGYTVMLKPDLSMYLQNYPHRLFPCVLMLFLVSLWYKNEQYRVQIDVVGYLVCIMLIIWNNEMGIAAIISWSAFQIVKNLQNRGKKWVLLVHIVLIPVCFFTAVVLTGLMNVLIGGTMISVREFLFPLGISSFMNEVLQYELTWCPSDWMIIISTLCVTMAMGITSTVILNRNPEKNDYEASIFAVGVIGLGTMVYSMNRPAFGNFYFSMPVFALCIVILIERYFIGKNSANKVLYYFGVSVATLSISMGLYNASGFFTTLQLRKELWSDNIQAEQVANEVVKTYTENTVGVGFVTSEIFAMAGLDNHYATMDFSDFTINDVCIQKSCDEFSKLDDKEVYITDEVLNIYMQFIPDAVEHFKSVHTLSGRYSDGERDILYYTVNNY